MRFSLKAYKGLPRNMYILFIAQIINRFGDFVMPFLTLYLTIKIGLSEPVVGTIVMLCSVISMPASLLGGRIADRFGRKKTYLYAQSIAALSLLPCAFIRNPALNVSCLMVTSFFHGFVRPAMSAMVTDILPPEKRQAGFSLQYLGINIGVSLGPIVAGFLFNNLLPVLFIGDAITSLIALYLIGANIKETHHEGAKQKAYTEAEKTERGSLLQALLKRPQLAVFFVIYIGFSFIYTQHQFALPLTLKEVYGTTGPTISGYLMSINAITVLTLTVFITSFTKKNHALINMAMAGIMYAVGFGMLGYVKGFPLFALSTIIWTTGEILVVTNFGVYVANNSPSNYRATFSALGSISWSVGGAFATSLGGLYIHSFGLNALWNLVIIIGLATSVCMLILRKTGTVHKFLSKEEAV